MQAQCTLTKFNSFKFKLILKAFISSAIKGGPSTTLLLCGCG